MPKDRTVTPLTWKEEVTGVAIGLGWTIGGLIFFGSLGIATVVYETSAWGRYYIRRRLGIIK